ncbi:hypothetical protein FGG08_004108 [Glutinoglossum americanum]|uniref:Uncharacterized protein n=1 Tax=Glutinoglossum americanum TaxID=1670608 RepID=A0A9P8L2U0_9PEZI|nr:hypothetical protein FGG08_004108 [Glutinoglossum americanum]
MLLHSFVFALAASFLLNFPLLAIASSEPIITPAPFLSRDAPKVGEAVDRQSVVPNRDLKARTTDEHLEDLYRRDFLTSCGYAYVDCGNGFCCFYGEVCYQSGSQTKCRSETYGDYSIDINSILESLSAIISGFPTEYDSYLTDFPTDTADLSAYLASFTSAELAGHIPTAPAATKSATNINGNGNGRGSSIPAFQSDGSSASGNSASANKGLSGGAIGGIVCGVVFIIAAIAGVLIFIMVRRKKQAPNNGAAPLLQPPPQMAQPGYQPQTSGPQTPQTVYSQAAPPYPGSENSAFMQQQQNTGTDYYKPPMAGTQEALGESKQQGMYVPPPAGQQQQWHHHHPPQNTHELAINPVPMQQQWQPAQPAHSTPVGGNNNPVYEMDTGLARGGA